MDADVVVHCISGDVLAELIVLPSASVRDIKRYLSEQLGVPRFRQRLVLGKVALEDAATVESLPQPLAVTFVVAPFVDDPPARPLITYINAYIPDKVEEALSLPMNPNSVRFAYTYGLLHYAINIDNVAVVALLCEAKADLARRNYEGRTPLGAAAARGNVAVIQALCDGGAEVDGACAVGEDGARPLEIALLADRLNAAQELGAWGAEPLDLASFAAVMKKHTQWYKALQLLAMALCTVVCSGFLWVSAPSLLPLANACVGFILLFMLLAAIAVDASAWGFALVVQCAASSYCAAGGLTAILRLRSGESSLWLADILTIVLFGAMSLSLLFHVVRHAYSGYSLAHTGRLMSWEERLGFVSTYCYILAPYIALVCRPAWRVWVLEHSPSTSLGVACMLGCWALWHAVPRYGVLAAVARALFPYGARRKRSSAEAEGLVTKKYPDAELPANYGTF